jgi:hypothetical protein
MRPVQDTPHFAAGDAFLRLLAGWPWIVAAAIAGGIIGLVLHSLRPPSYASTAAIRISIDYGRTLPLDDNAQRHVFNRVRDLVLADETLDGVLELLRDTEMGGSSVAQLRDSLRLDDFDGRWELVAITESPALSAEIANAWANSVLDRVEGALRHAWQAAELQADLYEAGCELQGTDDSSEALWACSRSTDQAPEKLVEALVREAELSYGLVPALSFSMLEVAVPADAPVIGARGTLVLSGGLAGMPIGIALALWRPRKSDPSDQAD